MKQCVARLVLFCLVFQLLCPSAFATEEGCLYDGVSYRGSEMSFPYFYTIDSGSAVITDCFEGIHGDAVLPETLGGHPVTGIGVEAFSGCRGLASVQIPDSVSFVGDGAFSSCAPKLVLRAAEASAAASYAKQNSIPLETPLLLGDSNSDGKLTLDDLTLSACLLAGWDVRANVYSADLNEDLRLRIEDLTALAEQFAGFDPKPTLFVIGDSTACEYTDHENYRSLSGYGEHLSAFLTSEIEVVNLASSGASSKDFVTREPYLTLKNRIKQGDYLFIGLGINDNKYNDDTRYSDPTKDRNTPGSYQYYLYHNYVRPALDVGATPVFVTSVCRRPSDGLTFAQTDLHVTADQPGKPGGDYPAAMTALGEELNIPVLDMTTATKNLHLTLGAEDNALLHKWETADLATLDKTHYSAYGARYVAYLLASALREVEALSPLVQDEISPPDKTRWATREVTTATPSIFVYSDGSSSLCHETKITKDCYAVPEGETLTEAHLADGVTVLKKEAFAGQTSLHTLTLPNSLRAIGISVFNGCSGLKLSELPPNLELIHYNAFLGCRAVTISHIPDTVAEIGSSAFYNCTSLETMRVDAAITSLTQTFRGCSSLTSVTLPPFLKEINKNTFRDCTSLGELSLHEGITLLGENALRSTALSSLTLPSSLKQIDDYAFYGTKSLKTLHYNATKAEFQLVNRSSNWSYGSKFTSLVCTDGAY
ncbi:MAG: leucine-rich repeat protein [Clostridia bacterium]|nr:leucine-rich repeat protein [Clostridia bacterium]